MRAPDKHNQRSRGKLVVPAGLLHTKGVRGVEPHSERTTKPPDIVGPHPHRVGGVQPFGFRKESLVADTAAPGVTSEPAEGGGLPKPAAAGLLARRPSPKGPRVSIIGDELRTQKSIHLSPLPSTQRSPVASEKATPSESVRTVTKPSQHPLGARHSTQQCPLIQMKLRFAGQKKSDERIKLINEILKGIRVVKSYAWEDFLFNRVDEMRQAEISLIRTRAYVRAVSSVCLWAAPAFAVVATFSTYVYVGHTLDEDSLPVIFTAMMLFNNLRFPLMMYPMVLTQYGAHLPVCTSLRSSALRAS